jgi:hypothetical protein
MLRARAAIAPLRERTAMRYRDIQHRDWLRSNALLGAAVAASAAVIGGPALVLPPELVMPALSGLLIIAALGIAAAAWLARCERAGSGVTCWDVSGALYFFGCCAGVLSEPEAVLALMEEIKIRK